MRKLWKKDFGGRKKKGTLLPDVSHYNFRVNGLFQHWTACCIAASVVLLFPHTVSSCKMSFNEHDIINKLMK